MAGRVTSPVLVGRDAELAAVDAGLDTVATRPGRHLLVTGEAGIGKSRLVEELAGRAQARGMRVLRGECDGIGGLGLPYAPIAEVLRSLARTLSPLELEAALGSGAGVLARIAPELGGAEAAASVGEGAGTAQGLAFEALLDLLGRLARDAPVVLILEDLHWADEATLDATRYLIDHTHDRPILLAMTVRPDELDPRLTLTAWLAGLGRSGHVERLDLQALDSIGVRELVAAIRGAEPSDELVARVLARSDGNAFFIEELIAAESGASAAGALSPTLRDVIHGRLAALSEACLGVLGVAAVSGRRVDHDLLQAVAGLPDEHLGAALREAARHRILSVDTTSGTDAYAFRHELLREVVYADLLPGERRRLHRAYADALASLGGPDRSRDAGYLAELATHRDLAHDTDLAFATAIAAGDAAARAFAHPAAQRRYQRALELWEQVSDPSSLAGLDRVELLDRAAGEANLSVDYGRELELRRAAVDSLPATSDPRRAGVLRARLGFALWNLQDLQAAVVVTREALALVPAAPPTLERVEVVARLGHLLTHYGRNREAEALGREAIALARTLGATSWEGFALNVLGAGLNGQGMVEDAVRALERSLEIALDGGDSWDLVRAYQNLSETSFEAGFPDRAWELLERGMQVAARAGMNELYRPLLLAQGALYAFGSGDWEDAARHAAEALSTVEVDSFDEAYVLAYVAELLVARSNDEGVERLLDRLAELMTRFGGDAQLLGPYAAARAQFESWRHRPDEAFAAVDEALTRSADMDDGWAVSRLVRLGIRSLADRAEVWRARRDPRAVRALNAALADLDRAAERCRVSPDGSPDGFELQLLADRATGSAERSRLEGAPDPELWRRARDLWRQRGRPYDVAYAEWRRAEAALARSDRETATAALNVASGIAHELGAGPLSVEIQSLARRARIDLRRAAGPTESERTAIDPAARLGLTARELEVLALLAQGRTNREVADALFISVNTAGVHVSRILDKLDASSRTEAATTAVRLGLVPP